MSDEATLYRRAYEREQVARQAAEQAVERIARELYIKNQKLEVSFQQLKDQQRVLVQNEKLATLGTLAAGIAHEINNPMAFINANLESLAGYLVPYQQLVDLLRSSFTMTDEERVELNAKITAHIDEHDLEFFAEELPDIIRDTRDGLERVREIVSNLRIFARSHTLEREPANVVSGLESTLKLLNSQFRVDIDVQKNLQPLPLVVCNLSELNQVFLNLLVNAAHALEGKEGAKINISTRADDRFVFIEISDNGCGMSHTVKEQMFVPFFTTKPVGKGTGMGMSIAYGIINDHGGDISVESTEGEGTRFTIKLPFNTEDVT